jgi:hypothetical protein
MTTAAKPDHVQYWGTLGIIVAAAVAWWGWKNMTDKQKASFG